MTGLRVTKGTEHLCFSVLQCVVVCCSVLSVMQCVAVCCSVLQCVTVFCSLLQCASETLGAHDLIVGVTQGTQDLSDAESNQVLAS